MKKIFSLLAAVLFAGSMMAGTSTLTFTAACGGTGTADDGATWTVTSDQDESNFDGTKGVHFGTGSKAVSYLTLSTSDIPGTITKIVVNASGASGQSPKVNVTVGGAAFGSEATASATATEYTFDGSATGEIAVTISQNSAKKALYCKSIAVTYTNDAASVATPLISGDAEFVGSTEVSITCETANADIYYTIDGSDPDPDDDAIAYDGAFTLDASATVKAVAILNEDTSAIASKKFTLIPTVTCAEVNELAKDAKAALGEVTVAYVNGANIYVKDAAGSTLVYAFDFGLTAGDVVTGLIGKMDIYNGLPEFKPTVTLADLTVTPGEAPAPEELTAAPVAADVNKYIVLKGVAIEGSFTSASKTSLTATFNEESVTFYNTFKIAYDFEAEKTYDVVGAVAIYNSNVQVYFISAEEHQEEVIPVDPEGLQSVSASTSWDFSKITANTANALYSSNGIKLTADSEPTKNEEVVYANYSADFMTFAEGFDGTTMAFTGEYPTRDNKYCQAGTLRFNTTVAGSITVKFSDTGSSASATAVKRYLVVNGEQTEYWTSRENNGDEPYAAQMDVVTEAIAVPAGDVTITGSSAIRVYNVTFTASAATALDNTAAEAKAVKRVVNGQLVIERDGVRYNAQGAQLH